MDMIAWVGGYCLGLASGGVLDLFDKEKFGRDAGYRQGYRQGVKNGSKAREKKLYSALEEFAQEHQLKITGTDESGTTIEYTVQDLLDKAK